MLLSYVLEGVRAQLLSDVLVLVYVVKHYCTVIIWITTTFTKAFMIHTTAEPRKRRRRKRRRRSRKEEGGGREVGGCVLEGERRRKRSRRLCTGVEDACLFRDV